MGLIFREAELDLGRDMTHEYEGVMVTPNDTLATYSAQIDAGAQPRSAHGICVATVASVITVTIATPGVVTWNGHGLGAGAGVVFSTTGALPTGITAGTTYYVLNPAANTFQIAATVGGAAINTTGTQSGVHTATTTGTGAVTVALDNEGNTAVITVAVPNAIIPITHTQVKATGTSAGAIYALFRKGG